MGLLKAASRLSQWSGGVSGSHPLGPMLSLGQATPLSCAPEIFAKLCSATLRGLQGQQGSALLLVMGVMEPAGNT